MFEFLMSLGLLGYISLAVALLAIWNLRKLWKFRSPLGSPQHKAWRNMGGRDHPDHLDPHHKR